MRQFGECGPGQGAAHRSVSRAAPRHHRATTLDESGSDDRSSLRGVVRWPTLSCGDRGTPDDRLRAVGISPQKLGYIRDLCGRTLDGSLALDALERLPDEAVIDALTNVKGIGRWTAEMFLMFRLHRPDVLPVGDLGIVKAVQRAYKLRIAPTPVRLTRLGENWRPYRSVACWYLWASLDNKGT
jgi:hypothetical protein